MLWVYIQIIIIGFCGALEDGGWPLARGSVVMTSQENVHVISKPLALNPGNGDIASERLYSLFLNRRYDEAFYELSDIYSGNKECLIFALSFFSRLIPPLLVVSILFLLSASRRLSPAFCNASDKKEALETLKAIVIVSLALFLLPHFAFNPFSPDYIEKVVLSVYLHTKPIGTLPQYYFSNGIALLIIPVYYMKKNAVSIGSLFAVDKKKLKIIILYLLLAASALIILIYLSNILYLLAGVGVSPEHGESNVPKSSLYDPKAFGFGLKLYFTISGPFMEELCFRGMILSLLRKHFKSYVGIVFSALLFLSSPSHLTSLPAIAVVFAGGITLAFVVQKTESLWPALILHSGWNFSFLL